LARINLWTFDLPPLRDRPEDIAPNIEYELERFGQANHSRVTFNREAYEKYLRFATSVAKWTGNFRDLSASVTRLATLAPGGRINEATVSHEIARLERSWATESTSDHCSAVLGDRADDLDRFDRVQLNDVLAVCARAPSLSEAGRTLFSESRKAKANPNDADRLRKYLLRFDLDFRDVQDHLRAIRERP
ncbi:MAG: sigma 54-dependent transcriptional regulator, partial [bacterium]